MWRTDSLSRIVDTNSRIHGDNLLISDLFECEDIPIHSVTRFLEFLRIDIRHTHRTGSLCQRREFDLFFHIDDHLFGFSAREFDILIDLAVSCLFDGDAVIDRWDIREYARSFTIKRVTVLKLGSYRSGNTFGTIDDEGEISDICHEKIPIYPVSGCENEDEDKEGEKTVGHKKKFTNKINSYTHTISITVFFANMNTLHELLSRFQSGDILPPIVLDDT